MKETRLIFCSDVHLCHVDWYGRTSADRMENMVENLNKFYDEKPYERIIFLGDYSLDHWAWNICGSWLREGVSNTEKFIKDFACRLKAPYYMAPGNHEQYGYENWQKITGTPRDDAFTLGGYLIISCDNFSGILDPDFHSDGEYTPTKIDFIEEKLAKYPDMPVILCGHFFDMSKESDEFFELLRTEKRITLLVCGHDHINEITDLGESAGNVILYHDGHYSYAGGRRAAEGLMWGFCETVLSDEGIDIKFVEPENTVILDGKVHEHKYREQNHVFVKRRDI